MKRNNTQKRMMTFSAGLNVLRHILNRPVRAFKSPAQLVTEFTLIS